MDNYKLGWIKRREHGLDIPWNKGTKGIMKSWNKGLTYKMDESKLKGKFFNCLICGKSFYRPLSYIRKAKYCSYTCAGKARIGTENFHNIDKGHTVIYKCEECGKEKKVILAFYNKAKHHFCSTKCSNSYWGKNHMGSNHWNWKGGTGRINRQTPEYNQWRVLVYKRDSYTCQECGHKHIDIVAHHIKSFSEFEDLRFKTSNGQTLCRSCHKKIHRDIGLKTRFIKEVV